MSINNILNLLTLIYSYISVIINAVAKNDSVFVNGVLVYTISYNRPKDDEYTKYFTLLSLNNGYTVATAIIEKTGINNDPSGIISEIIPSNTNDIASIKIIIWNSYLILLQCLYH